MNDEADSGRQALVGRYLGPAVFLLVLVAPDAGLGDAARRTAAVVLWMAVWWVTEAVPLAATSLLPVVLFPLLQVRGVRDVTPNYTNHMVLTLGRLVLPLG